MAETSQVAKPQGESIYAATEGLPVTWGERSGGQMCQNVRGDRARRKGRLRTQRRKTGMCACNLGGGGSRTQGSGPWSGEGGLFHFSEGKEKARAALATSGSLIAGS